MKLSLCLLPLGLLLCLQWQVQADLSRSEIQKAVRAAKVSVDSAYEYSRRESIDRVKRNDASPADVLRLMKQPSGLTREAVRAADYMDYAIIHLQGSMNRRRRRATNTNSTELSQADIQAIAEEAGCTRLDAIPLCVSLPDSDKYRTASGVCNNKNHPRWGASNTPLLRHISAEYQDGISRPKGWDRNVTVNGHFLPLVRLVSNQILATGNDVETDPLYSMLVTFFAQWTDHDLTLTPQSPIIRPVNSTVDCSKSCERTEPCFPIEIPANDTRISQGLCMPFIRSSPACSSGRQRQQMNALTSFLDVGQVYGADDTKARSLRDLTSDLGLMRVNDQFNDNGRELLPFSTAQPNTCATRGRITNTSNAEEVPCFVAGDGRVNENIALTTIHTVMLREHNRLARKLAQLNPHWNGTKLYQEARKILGGISQVITFRDYLFHILGPDVIAERLSTYPGYDDEVDPSIANVFATAAYRFAHLMVHPTIFRLDENYNEHPQYPSTLLHKAFSAPWRVVFEGGVDPLLRGAMGRPAKLKTQNHMMADELRERLFKFTAALALDLGSLNMQRGRDHGLPGYNKWREFCGLSQPQNVEELGKVLKNKDLAERLLALYKTPENIDVWLGGLAEPPIKGGRVGPLFACLIADQFQRIRHGDRLWWENDGVFTEQQKASLREASLARIICDNTGITELPHNPFQYRPRGDGYTHCSKIPAFDLSPWQEDSSKGSRGPPGPQGPPGPPGPVVKVAFAARLGNDIPKQYKPLIFNEVIYNKQKSYDPKTGIFTCTIPGVYEFHVYLLISNDEATVDLMRDRERILHLYTTRHDGYLTSTGVTLARLDKGDKVYLAITTGKSGLVKDSQFSGHLLFTE